MTPPTLVQPHEHFVDSKKAAEFLGVSSKHVLDLAHEGIIPSYDVSLPSAKRKTLRFRLSELSSSAPRHVVVSSTPQP
jgi:hypothetical protein